MFYSSTKIQRRSRKSKEEKKKYNSLNYFHEILYFQGSYWTIDNNYQDIALNNPVKIKQKVV